MRLSDDILTELHDAYLDHAEGVRLARTCRRLHRLLIGRSLVYNPNHPMGSSPDVEDESVVRRLAVTSVGETPRSFPVPSRYSGLRRFRWLAFREGHDTITAVLRAAADLPFLDDLEVNLNECDGLTDASVDGVVGQPIRAVRRAAHRRLRSLAVRVKLHRLGVLGVGCVVAAAASPPAGADRDRLEDLTLKFTDKTGHAVAAVAPVGEMTGLRRLNVDINGEAASPESIRFGLLNGAVCDHLDYLCIWISVNNHTAVRDLFAAVGRCRALRRLEVVIWYCSSVDWELSGGVFAPLAATALTHLSFRICGVADLSDALLNDLCVTVDALSSLRELIIHAGRINTRIIAPGIRSHLCDWLTHLISSGLREQRY